MYKKVLSSLGFGCATVDAVLRDREVVAGEPLHAELVIRGGDTEQEIEAAILEIVTECRLEVADNASQRAEVIVASSRVEIGKIGVGEERVITLQIDVPAGAPITDRTTKSELRTRLEIRGGVDPRDSDQIEIKAGRILDAILNGMEKAGFLLAETEVKHRPGQPHPVVQEFDFRPVPAVDFEVDDLEMSFFPIEGGVEIRVVVDGRARIGSRPDAEDISLRVMEVEIPTLDMGAKLREAISRIR